MPTCHQTQISGWGRVSYDGENSPVLKQADVRYVSEKVCKSQYKKINIDIASSMMCAGIFDIGGIDSCTGDSGGTSIAVYTVPYIYFHSLLHFSL